MNADMYLAYIRMSMGRHYNPDNKKCPNNGKEKGEPGWINCIECKFYKKCWLKD